MPIVLLFCFKVETIDTDQTLENDVTGYRFMNKPKLSISAAKTDFLA